MVNETEIIEFMNDIENIMEVVKRVNFKYNFDIHLFMLWKILKESGNVAFK
jgi:hypothetical protein